MQGLIESLRFACALTEAAKATPKQASYAHSLAMKNPDTWNSMYASYGLTPAPTIADFEGLSKKDISKVIGDLKNTAKASRKQVGFALSLLMQLGKADYVGHGFEKTIGRPTAAKLSNLPMTTMSTLINDLKKVLVNS